VTEALAAFENQSIQGSRSIEATAAKLLQVREPDMARRIPTSYSSQRAGDALRLGESLLGSIEARCRPGNR
jgi:hypothetical protein